MNEFTELDYRDADVSKPGLDGGVVQVAALGAPSSGKAPSTSIWPPDLLNGGAERLGGERAWWLVYTRSRQEKAVAERILPREVPFYLPLIKRSSLTRGRTRVAHVPLFVGYLFLFGTPEEREVVLKTNRVSTTQLVKDAGRLQQDLARIADLISRNAPLSPEARLEPGEWVRVKSGPLAGLEGTIIRRKGKSLLLVAVDYLQQGASVEIGDFQVESI